MRIRSLILGLILLALSSVPATVGQPIQARSRLAPLGEKIHSTTDGGPTSERLYTATPNGLLASNDDGQTWKELVLPTTSREIFAVVVDPKKSSIV